jgi:hypothetical protein
VGAVFVGSVVSLPLVWDFADAMNALMALPNILSLWMLSGVAVAETRKYLWNGNLDADADIPLATTSPSSPPGPSTAQGPLRSRPPGHHPS